MNVSVLFKHLQYTMSKINNVGPFRRFSTCIRQNTCVNTATCAMVCAMVCDVYLMCNFLFLKFYIVFLKKPRHVFIFYLLT